MKNIPRFLFQSVLFISISISAFSQSNSGLIKVIVSPDHKELQIYQETGHWTFPEENEAVNTWLLKQFKVK